MDVSAHRAPEAQGGAHADRPAALSARQGPAGGSSTALTLGPELARGKEPRLRLAVDVIYPAWLLLDCLKASADEQPDTRIELYETVLGGTDEALIAGAVDLAIGNAVPGGFLGDALMQKRFVCAAAPGHPLHALERAWPSMTCGHIVTWLCAVKACSGGVPSAGSTRNAGPYPTRPRRSTQHAWARAMHGFPKRLSVQRLRRAVSVPAARGRCGAACHPLPGRRRCRARWPWHAAARGTSARAHQAALRAVPSLSDGRYAVCRTRTHNEPRAGGISDA
jgi:LysR substrate binding domain